MVAAAEPAVEPEKHAELQHMKSDNKLAVPAPGLGRVPRAGSDRCHARKRDVRRDANAAAFPRSGSSDDILGKTFAFCGCVAWFNMCRFAMRQPSIVSMVAERSCAARPMINFLNGVQQLDGAAEHRF